MRPGDPVIAIGNPLGLGSTVTVGIISALDRDIQSSQYDAFMQTDAAINHGNSGGPLFNLDGDVIGVNTALYSTTSASAGLGFSIPGNDAQFVLNNLKEFHRVRFGYLGANFDQVTQGMADAAGSPEPWGGIVTTIDPGSPAEKAGLQRGDILLAIGDHETRELRNIRRLAAGAEIGTDLPLTVWRHGTKITLHAVTTEAPGAPRENVMAAMPPPAQMHEDLGLQAAPITPDQRVTAGLKPDEPALVVTSVSPNSMGQRMGAKVGQIVLSVQNQPVGSRDDVLRIVKQAQAEGRKYVLLLILDDKTLRWVAMPIPPSS
jgi:serine protease Do